MIRLLLVDDDSSMCELLQVRLKGRGIGVRWFLSAPEALAALVGDEFDVVMTDLNMGGMNGLELCERIVANRPDLPVVVLTAHTTLDNAVAALRVGAYDFITKPIDLDALAFAVQRAATHHELQVKVRRLERTAATAQGFDDLLGASAAMVRLFELLGRVADLDASVLISGETGTGKELAARALHRRSRRGAGPFVAVNCAAVPEQLLESELFGYVKGAFTDARTDRPGLFVQAHGGTLFLDEIGELPLQLQPKLLRSLQERRVRPIGSTEEVPFDVRLIAATNRDLERDVEQGRFREDLFYRVAVIEVAVPPLRSRSDDVLLLARHFIDASAAARHKGVTGLSSRAAEKLLAYSWPGNARELQNCVEHAVALSNYDHITVDDLPERIRSYRRAEVVLSAGEQPTQFAPLEDVERRYMLRVLKACGGNKTLAARLLGVNRRTLARKFGPDPEVGEGPDEG